MGREEHRLMPDRRSTPVKVQSPPRFNSAFANLNNGRGHGPEGEKQTEDQVQLLYKTWLIMVGHQPQFEKHPVRTMSHKPMPKGYNYHWTSEWNDYHKNGEKIMRFVMPMQRLSFLVAFKLNVKNDCFPWLDSNTWTLSKPNTCLISKDIRVNKSTKSNNKFNNPLNFLLRHVSQYLENSWRVVYSSSVCLKCRSGFLSTFKSSK
ncbi:hypothetical protein NPIL_243931 [Nephila pilipes]|uniref:Uncharacterized protein n=1 Tax=Nephila pilipes TaxID=299642 RepID=A0A8X6I8Y9_NEPPI|nr:hypothetical protein NPIL_243931 [Nephila pilipes]